MVVRISKLFGFNSLQIATMNRKFMIPFYHFKILYLIQYYIQLHHYFEL